MVRDALEHPERMLLWRAAQSRVADNHDEALEYLTQALAVAPDEARVYLEQGRVGLDLGLPEAADDFREALRLIEARPNHYTSQHEREARAGLIRGLIGQGNCDEAQRAYAEAAAFFGDIGLSAEELTRCERS
jgi:tetratricopeptide (TPR) repeat protein